MSTRLRHKVKSKKRSREQIEPSDDQSDSDDNDSSDNYKEPSTKKRKLNDSDAYAETFRATLKRTSILLQNTKQDKFVEIGMNSDNKSYSIIKGKLGSKGKKQIKHFKSKKNAWNVAVKALTDKMQRGYAIVESEDEAEEEEEEVFVSSSSSEDIDIVDGILDGLSFSMSGGLSKPQNIIETLIINNGGKVTNTVDAQHTDFMLVKNKNAVTDSKKCVAANTLNIPIVKEQFVHDSIHQDKITDYKLYLVDEKTDNIDETHVSVSSSANDDEGEDIQTSNIMPIPDMEPVPVDYNNHNNNHNASLSKEAIAYNYNYLSSALSLRTTDECIKAELLTVTDPVQGMETELSCMKIQHDTGKILAEIKNVFTAQECQRIIQQSNRLSFQNMSKANKYDPSVRKSDRLVVLDPELSNVLWNRLNRIIKEDIVDTYYVSTVPLGFGVLNDMEENKWEISSINTAMRINRYDANSEDFFTFHKDAQYAPSAEERSLFTLIIFLNDDFDGGQTNFYFQKNDDDESDHTIVNTDCTINEEMKQLGGVKEGFDCKSIHPSIGDAIIFSPDVIHEGCKVATSDTKKYILKTEVVVKRK
eukprot:72690_1